jgi:hypothetical protein
LGCGGLLGRDGLLFFFHLFRLHLWLTVLQKLLETECPCLEKKVSSGAFSGRPRTDPSSIAGLSAALANLWEDERTPPLAYFEDMEVLERFRIVV